jgi:hypothetical protein
MGIFLCIDLNYGIVQHIFGLENFNFFKKLIYKSWLLGFFSLIFHKSLHNIYEVQIQLTSIL